MTIALGRVVHALQCIDLARLKSPLDLRPGAEADLDVEPHRLRDRLGQLDGETGGTSPIIQILIRRQVRVTADHDLAVRRQLERGEPFGVQLAMSPVGDDQRQAFVEKRQRIAIAFRDGEAEILAEPLDGPINHAQIVQPHLLEEPERNETLDNHRVAPPVRQVPERLLQGGHRDDVDAAVLTSKKLLGVVALQHRDRASAQVLETADAFRLVAHDDGAMQRYVGDGEVEERFALRRAPHERQRIDLTAFQPSPHIGPNPRAKRDIAPHRGQRRPQQLDGETRDLSVGVGEAEWRVIDLGGGLDLRAGRGIKGIGRRGRRRLCRGGRRSAPHEQADCQGPPEW